LLINSPNEIFVDAPCDLPQDLAIDLETNFIYRDCSLLSRAVYEENPELYLQTNGHRFTSMVQPDRPILEGRYIIVQMVCGDVKHLYIAIRGSYYTEDWTTNFNAWPSLKEIGTVHTGWYSRMEQLPSKYLLSKLHEGYYIYVTGHSLGGAVAQLLTCELLGNDLVARFDANELSQRLKCICFAAPMVLIGSAADRMNNLHRNNFVNFVQIDDIVPKVLSWGKRH
jgi:hypothetical protein